jgi:hypothetical protein
MSLIRYITNTFIDVFGITHPSPRQERVATIFISTLLALIAIGLLTFLAVLYLFSHR